MELDPLVAALIAGVRPLRIAQYSLVSAFSLLLYDYAITFRAEVTSIWQSRFTFVKALFLLNRYIGLAAVAIDVIVMFKPGLTAEVCTNWILYHFALSVLTIVIGQVILLCRIHALYGQNWKITGCLLAPIIICAAGCGAVDYASRAKGGAPPAPLQGCYIASLPHWARFVWVPPLFTEISLCFAMIYKAWTIWRERDLRDVLRARIVSPLLRRIILDSIIYFFSILMILLMNTIIWLVAPLDYTYIGIPWAETIPCIMGSRLLLNTREHYVKDASKVSATGASNSTSGIVLRPFRSGKQHQYIETIDIAVVEETTIQPDF
ncbi:hypothetical protein M422DRAFT_35605 [Sphaerobolus stellatus SS14]|uniref:DUF6533 domain-containing protein n=1 Tax=Sphaerobolus stellatus (strain SS14) TaxID=990650 RepID=A0A0C9V6Y0_SPHS4|nr:hypothetical protein M422DRAFT_35605 [Sphaerobolus stellatus SS14]